MYRTTWGKSSNETKACKHHLNEGGPTGKGNTVPSLLVYGH